jgi:hypothetical protein
VKHAGLDILTGITLTQEWMVNEVEQRLRDKADEINSIKSLRKSIEYLMAGK